MATRVLVVDDDLPGLTLAEEVLAQLAVDVVCAMDGREGIDAFLSQRFDIIFMEHPMPNMTGPEATFEIRRIECERGWSRTPIIALTASAFPSEIQEYRRAGSDDVLLKPYRIEELRAMLRKWVCLADE